MKKDKESKSEIKFFFSLIIIEFDLGSTFIQFSSKKEFKYFKRFDCKFTLEELLVSIIL
jgi:hypothetical protein